MKDRLRKVRETLTDECGKKYSQAKFADVMNVTRDMIATYEIGRVEPSSLFISTLCERFGVNEEWLRTGTGEMFKPLSREEEIANIVAAMFNDDDPFKMKLIKIISELTPQQVETLKDIAKELANDEKLPN